MKKIIVIAIIFLIAFNTAYAAYIPPNMEKFGHDFYTVYAEPNLTASLMGSNEYYRGDKAPLLIQLMNDGKIEGFKSEKDPASANEVALSQLEVQLENQATTAIGVFATLLAEEGVPVDVKTGPQPAGSLRSGQLSTPVEFSIEIHDNAKAGKYNLKLKLEYDYQKDAQVEGNVSQSTVDYNFWYESKNQSQYIEILVRPEADFKVKEVRGNLVAGEEGAIQVIYENTGEEPAKDAVAQIKVVDPFSSSDYTSYLGDLQPGESKKAEFKVKVDKSAISKTYSIKSEIKFEDSKGKLITSDTVKIPVTISPAETLEQKIQRNMLLIIMSAGIVVAIVAYVLYRRTRNKVK